MPDLNTDEPAAPQGLAETKAVLRAAKTAMAGARKAEQERRRQTRKGLKDEIAGLTPELKAARKLAKGAEAAQRYRDKKAGERMAAQATVPARPARAPLSRAQLALAVRPLHTWLSEPGRSQRMIVKLGHQKRYVQAAAVMLMIRHEEGADPSPVAFAARLMEVAKIDMNRIDAAHMLRQLHKIEDATGPWLTSMTGSDETMTRPDETSRTCMTDSDETSRKCMTRSDETSFQIMGTDFESRRYA